MIHEPEALRVFYSKQEEKIAYLFFTSRSSWLSWEKCLNWWTISLVMPNRPQSMFGGLGKYKTQGELEQEGKMLTCLNFYPNLFVRMMKHAC